MNEIPQKEPSIARPLIVLGLLGLVQLVGGLFMLTLLYGIVVIIFRHAFGVELWNPFA